MNVSAQPLRYEDFERALVGRQARTAQADKQAAVAILVRFDEQAEVLLMRRSVQKGDRWSGQICFPGGKAEQEDADLPATATRETYEELGFQLHTCGQYLGALDAIPAMSRGGVKAPTVSPFVYAQTQAPEIQLGVEAAHSFWLPLDLARSGALDSTYNYNVAGEAMALPCWQFKGEVIWGLTYGMLRTLLRLIKSSGK